MKYKIKKDFWEFLSISGVNLKDFRFQIKVCDLTWRKVKNEGVITQNVLAMVQFAAKDFVTSFKEFRDKFVLQGSTPEEHIHNIELDTLREVLIAYNAQKKIKYIDVANFLGVGKQIIYRFTQGEKLNLERTARLAQYISIVKNQK